MPRFKTRHLILGIAVLAEGLGAYSLVVRQPQQRALREAREYYIFDHERRIVPFEVRRFESRMAKEVRRTERLAEKWEERDRPDRAAHYRQEAAYYRFWADQQRRKVTWHTTRRDALARRGSFDIADERAIDRAKEAEFEAESISLPSWQTLFRDWADRPPEDATSVIE